MMRGVKYMLYEEGMRKLGLFSLEKRKLIWFQSSITRRILWRRDGLFKLVHSERTSCSGHKLKEGKFKLAINSLWVWPSTGLGAWGSSGISSLGETQNLTGQDPENSFLTLKLALLWLEIWMRWPLLVISSLNYSVIQSTLMLGIDKETSIEKRRKQSTNICK